VLVAEVLVESLDVDGEGGGHRLTSTG
jgi:hypothetical protein